MRDRGPPVVAATDLRRVLHATVRGEATIDSILAAARRGATFTPSELLGMQVAVFRYSQVVEVMSRATDRVVGGLKQTLSMAV